jgi:CRP/FNR family transcriptional regulator, anaerobic regulatory protein
MLSASGSQHAMKTLAPPTTCSRCKLRGLCLPLGLSAQDMDALDQLVRTRIKIPRGTALFRPGEQFKSLYAIRTGFFKTTMNGEDGDEQVTGFYMAGELMGLDGIARERYHCQAVALEDAEVCELDMTRIEEFAQRIPALQHHMHKLMSQEIVHDHEVMVLLGSRQAEARVAQFLLNLLERLGVRGQSSKELVLRMTREEIGSYLGLKLETVSRSFSKLAQQGLIAVKQRNVEILQTEQLHVLANLH